MLQWRKRTRSRVSRKIAVTSYPAYTICPQKIRIGCSHRRLSFSPCKLVRKQLIVNRSLPLKLTHLALYRIWHARVGLCFGEERSEHHDEKYRGYCFGRLHVLVVRLWNVLRPRSTVKSIHCHWRLFTRSARRRSTHGANIRYASRAIVFNDR